MADGATWFEGEGPAAAEALLERLEDEHGGGGGGDDDKARGELDALVGEAEAAQRTAAERARVLCWKGRARACGEAFDGEAERLLGKAVRLAPGMVEAWNALGQLYWKKPDLDAARNCFEGALKHRRNKVSLRCLSMVVRATGGGGAAELAKEAVSLDVQDGHSWYILGNAYLAHFFSASRAAEDLDRALKAYERAEQLPRGGAAANPDLYFNRAQVHEYHENYTLAVADYSRARDLDPSLGAAERVEAVQRFVRKLARLVATGAGLKPKRMQAAVAALQKAAQGAAGAAAAADGLKLVPLSRLDDGGNLGRAVLGRVLAPVSRGVDIPTSFVIVDAEARLGVVSLYNVTGAVLDRVRVGDTVRVQAPRLKTVTMRGDGALLTFPALHVSNPTAVVVNGKALERGVMALPGLSLKRPAQ